MEFIANNYQNILLVLASAYPPLLFLLPPNVASKIDIGIKVLKVVADTLEKAKNTRQGLCSRLETDIRKKTFVQKPKN